MNDTSAIRATRVRHECNTIVTRVLHEQHEYDVSATRTTRVKNFDFGNATSKNIYSHSFIYYMRSEWLQGEKQFHSKNYLLEMPHSHAKMRLKNAPQKLGFFREKAISKKLKDRL